MSDTNQMFLAIVIFAVAIMVSSVLFHIRFNNRRIRNKHQIVQAYRHADEMFAKFMRKYSSPAETKYDFENMGKETVRHVRLSELADKYSDYMISLSIEAGYPDLQFWIFYAGIPLKDGGLSGFIRYHKNDAEELLRFTPKQMDELIYVLDQLNPMLDLLVKQIKWENM